MDFFICLSIESCLSLSLPPYIQSAICWSRFLEKEEMYFIILSMVPDRLIRPFHELHLMFYQITLTSGLEWIYYLLNQVWYLSTAFFLETAKNDICVFFVTYNYLGVVTHIVIHVQQLQCPDWYESTLIMQEVLWQKAR